MTKSIIYEAGVTTSFNDNITGKNVSIGLCEWKFKNRYVNLIETCWHVDNSKGTKLVS